MHTSSLFKKHFTLPLYLILGASLVIIGEIVWLMWSIWGIQNRPLDWWGDVGGLIGGVTAPVTGLLSAILLYITFQKQQETLNEEIQRNKNEIEKNKIIRDVERVRDRFKDIVDLVNGVSHGSSTGGTIYSGVQAFVIMKGNLTILSQHKPEILFIIHLLKEIKQSLNKIRTDNESLKTLLNDEKDSLENTVLLYTKDMIIAIFKECRDADIQNKLKELQEAYP